MRKILSFLVSGLTLFTFALGCGGGGGGGGTATGGGGSTGGTTGGGGPLNLSFGAATNLVVGDISANSHVVAAGDYNQDGFADVAALDSGTDKVVVFLHEANASGAFQPSTPFNLQPNPVYLTQGIFKTGGGLDLAVASTNFLSILPNPNNGSGTFGTREDEAENQNPTCIAIGDFDKDGKLDAATFNADKTVSIFYGDGNYVFIRKNYAPALATDLPDNPKAIATGDFNGDGQLDLAMVGAGSDFVTVWTNSGDANLDLRFKPADVNKNQALPPNPGPQSLTAGDFNGDQKPDLAVPNANTKNVSVFINNGNGTFAAATLFPTGGDPFSIAVADFNLDQKLDLAVANFTGKDGASGDVGVYLGNGSGGFADPQFFSSGTDNGLPNKPRSVAVGDFNQDGKPDIVLGNDNGVMVTTDPASVLLNTSS